MRKIRVVAEVDAPSPEQVRNYLLSRGWRRQEHPRPEVLVFAGPADDRSHSLTVLLPASQDADDYPLRLEEMFRGLSLAEGRPALDVFNDVKMGPPAEGTPSVATTNGTPPVAPTKKARRPSQGRRA